MSMTFTKLFSSITESTVWCEPDRIRIVWITMLAMADARGRVWASVPGLANRARVPVDDAKAAIDHFLSPDEYSRTPDNDGRRIEPIDGGWRLLNHEKYRAIRDEEAIKESKRKYINTKRAIDRADVEPCRSSTPTVDRSRHNAEADTEAEASSTVTPRVIGVHSVAKAPPKRGSRLSEGWKLPKAWGEWSLSEFHGWTAETVRLEAAKFADFWHSKAGKDACKLDWQATWRNWCRNATPAKATLPVTVPGPEVWKPEAPLTASEMAAQAELRRKAVNAIKMVS